MSNPRAAVIGGGPAGLMAAETLSAQGIAVDVYDAMPSVGRKFLLAGKGGMNLTHSEPPGRFNERYGAGRADLEPMLKHFGASELRAWAAQLGIDTFVGSSGRVFPTDMKAAPMLRAWLHRLRGSGVRFHMRHRWIGWDDESSGDLGFASSGDLPVRDPGFTTPGDLPVQDPRSGTADAHFSQTLRFATPEGERRVQADAVVLALGIAVRSHLQSTSMQQSGPRKIAQSNELSPQPDAVTMAMTPVPAPTKQARPPRSKNVQNREEMAQPQRLEVAIQTHEYIPEPPLPLTQQERLVIRMMRHNTAQQLSEYTPDARARQLHEDAQAYHDYFAATSLDGQPIYVQPMEHPQISGAN